MKRGALLALPAALLALAVPAAAGHGTRAPCPPPHSRVLAHDRVVRVWSRGGTFPSAWGACDARRGTSMTLLDRPRGGLGGASLHGFVLAGEVLAFLETRFGVDSGSTTLAIVDLAARRRLRNATVGSYVDAGLIHDEQVGALLLTPRGSAAWVKTRSDHGVAGPSTVELAARTGPVLALDEGPGIDPASLRLEGATLSWSDGGVRHLHAMP